MQARARPLQVPGVRLYPPLLRLVARRDRADPVPGSARRVGLRDDGVQHVRARQAVGPAAQREGTRAGDPARRQARRDDPAGCGLQLAAATGARDRRRVRRPACRWRSASRTTWPRRTSATGKASRSRRSCGRTTDAPPDPRPGSRSGGTRPGSRRLAPFRARVSDAVEAILARHPSGNVFVVCHGAVINAYLAPILGVDHGCSSSRRTRR